MKSHTIDYYEINEERKRRIARRVAARWRREEAAGCFLTAVTIFGMIFFVAALTYIALWGAAAK